MRINTVAVYWSAREEAVEACASRLADYLQALGSAFPSLSSWYDKKNRNDTRALVPEDTDGLVALLREGRNRRDVGGEVMDDLGFRVGLWNKHKEAESMAIGITCGLYSNARGLGNAVTLSLPKDLAALSLEGDDALETLLALQIKAWTPDWGAVFASQGDAAMSREGNTPFLDKLLWVRDGRNRPLFGGAPAHEKIVFGGGLYYR